MTKSKKSMSVDIRPTLAHDIEHRMEDMITSLPHPRE